MLDIATSAAAVCASCISQHPSGSAAERLPHLLECIEASIRLNVDQAIADEGSTNTVTCVMCHAAMKGDDIKALASSQTYKK
jgi:hypothetical protein